MKILIAPWGNPLVWKEVEYMYKGRKKSDGKNLKDPLPLIKEEENPDKIIIVSVDTLANALLKNNISNYSDIREKIQEEIYQFCQNELKFKPDKVIISYGFGEFSKMKFLGSAMDFYYDVFKELSFFFSELEVSGKIEVIFDATHGINWTTILTYRALREILEILAYVYDVDLKVLNSDPFVENIKLLNINVIENVKILPRIMVYNDEEGRVKPIKPYEKLEKEEKKNLGKKVEQFLDETFDFMKYSKYYKEEILVFLGSFYFALPVFILSYMPCSSNVKFKINEISKEFERNIKLKNSVKLEVLRELKYTENFANFSKAYLVSSILEKLGFGKLTDIPLSKIEELKNKVFVKLSVESNRIDKEISDVKDLQNLNNQYQVYNVIKSGSIGNQIDKRNFFAHAGFEYNTIEIKKENGEIYVRIYDNYRRQAEAYITDDLPKI
jgi:CRISPR-associated protein Csx1